MILRRRNLKGLTALGLALALPAKTRTIGPRVPVIVAAFAFAGSHGDGRRVHAPGGVFLSRHRFQMSRVYARPVSTNVVEVQPVRNWANQQFITETVGHLVATVDGDNSVTVCVWRSRPNPTPRHGVDGVAFAETIGGGFAGVVSCRHQQVLRVIRCNCPKRNRLARGGF